MSNYVVIDEEDLNHILRAIDCGADVNHVAKELMALRARAIPQRPPVEQIEKIVDGAIFAAWKWGESCGIDNVAFNEQGDSHNEMLRRDSEQAKDRIYALITGTGQ